MFIFKVDPKFIIIFPQRMPQILFYIKTLLNGLRYSKLKEEQQMKLFTTTNRHQPQPQPVPRARISSFLAILMSHYSRWIKRGHCQYVIFFSVSRCTDCFTSFTSLTRPRVGTDWWESVLCRPFLFPSQYTHIVETIDPDYTIDF